MERKLTAILSADVAGFSRLVENDDEATVRTLTSNRTLMESLVQKHHGRVVDSPGDNMLAEFPSVVDAVRAAISIQMQLHIRNLDIAPERRMRLRIGINVGDVVIEGERLYGDGVNIAARIESLADVGGIYLSASAFEQVENKVDVSFEYAGEHQVKNITKPLRVWRVITEYSNSLIENTATAATASPGDSRKIALQNSRLVSLIVVFLAITISLVIYFLQTRSAVAPLGGSASSKSGAPVVAVLPFDSLSEEAGDRWLSDGITEDIITLLAQSRAMQIIASNATFAFDPRTVDIDQVRDALGADFLVRGSVRRLGDRIRVTVRLIDSESGAHVWAKKYDRPLVDLFAVQDEVTAGIAATVGDEIFKVAVVRATQAKTGSLDAWGQTWRADANWSIEDARAAILLDEKYARSHAVLARNLALHTVMSTRDPKRFAEAIAAARRAVALAPEDVLVTAYLGVTLLWSGDPEQALVVLERIPKISPSFAEGFAWYGDTLIHNGRPEEGLTFVERAIQLTPQARSLWNYEVIKAEGLIHLGRFDEARELLQHAIQDGTVAYPFAFLAGVEAQTGNVMAAQNFMLKANEIYPGYSPADFRALYNFISTDDGGPNFKIVFDALEAAVP